MLYREIIAVCSEIHTKHINPLCGQNVELLNVKLAVNIVTTGLYRVKEAYVINLNNTITWINPTFPLPNKQDTLVSVHFL